MDGGAGDWRTSMPHGRGVPLELPHPAPLNRDFARKRSVCTNVFAKQRPLGQPPSCRQTSVSTAATHAEGSFPDFGSRLEEDLGATAVYIRYNTGRHIATNGQELRRVLTDLVRHWPTTVDQIVLVGHSIGGLVARDALMHTTRVEPWQAAATHLICLGSPHTGTPLERVAAWTTAMLERSVVGKPLAWFLALRSDGIKDLARGATAPAEATMDLRHGIDADLTVLPPGLKALYVTATLSRTEGSYGARAFGDLLVGASSAGVGHDADQHWIGGLHHFDLLRHDDVYRVMVDWLQR